ncbi:MAG TPA: NAD(P)H-binding protein [Thermoplasmata archaeon]|nr:NAD(P)H-binding protein [Thermoplasmata archaeon]
MSGTSAGRPRLVVIGGCSGLVGRAVRAEFGPDHAIRSVHRRPDAAESAPEIEFVAADAAEVRDWAPIVAGADVVLTLAWYREGHSRRFGPLAAGLERAIDAAEAAGVRRLLHLSVPDAPATLERDLPYLALRRAVDRHLAGSRLDYVIVRPTMLFAPGDRLATVMLRTIHRYGRLPIFGDGSYHLSPVSTRDLAAVLRREAAVGGRRTVTVGGPRRWSYRELAERMFAALGRRPRYLRLSPRNGVRLAWWLEHLGSTLLYAYEVEWLVSDRLGAAPYPDLGRPLDPIEPFLDAEAARLRGDPRPAAP